MPVPVPVFVYCGNMSAAGEILRLDNIDVISLLRRLSHTYPVSRTYLVPNYMYECMRSQYLQYHGMLSAVAKL